MEELSDFQVILDYVFYKNLLILPTTTHFDSVVCVYWAAPIVTYESGEKNLRLCMLHRHMSKAADKS